MTQNITPPPAPPPPPEPAQQNLGINELAVAAPANFYNGPNWHGAWASVANGTYGGPNQIVPRKSHPEWE